MAKKLMGAIIALLILCAAGNARVEQEGVRTDLPQPLPVFVVEIQQNDLTDEVGDPGSFASSQIPSSATPCAVFNGAGGGR